MTIDAVKLEQMRYFIAALETGSFVAAGERLNITPTSIAHGVSALEDALNNKFLIRRRATGVTPNREGQRFAIACRKVFQEIESMGEQFQQNSGALSGELTIGCQEALIWSLVPIVIAEMSKIHPKVDISVKTIFLDDELMSLENGDIDLLVSFATKLRRPDLIEKIYAGPFYSQSLCRPQPYATVRADHPLCRKNKFDVSLEELADYPHIFSNDGAAFLFYNSMYSELGLSPKVYMESDSGSGAMAVVGKSESVYLKIVRPSIDLSPLGDKLTYLKLRNEVPKTVVWAITHENGQTKISEKAKAFIDICQQKFDDGTMKDNFFY